LIIGAFYIGFAFSTNDMELVWQTGGFLLLPLGLIWFSEEAASYTGSIGPFRPQITTESPAGLVEFLGWGLLLLPAVLFIYGLAS